VFELKICNISVKNFRTLKDFQADMGKYNVIIGKNNTGKSNLLWAIYFFYNFNELTIEDITKDENGDPIKDENGNPVSIEITLTFDDLTELERQNNAKYYYDGKIKVCLRGFIDENNKFQKEFHGFIQDYKLIFPENFENDNLKQILTNSKTPLKRGEIKDFPELSEIIKEIQPSGKISNDTWNKSRERYLEQHPEIRKDSIEKESEDKYQGFIKTNQPDVIGSCILIPALDIPSRSFDTSKKQTPLTELFQLILKNCESDNTISMFKDLQKTICDERQSKIQEIESKFENELKDWNTKVNIQLKEQEIGESFPIYCDVFFNDGFSTDLKRKGTGLQRYIFFKLLKIYNERKLGDDISLILLFEEPEAHLHPQFQREIASILKKLAIENEMNYQIFITTHSPQFVDIENLDEIFIFNKGENGYTQYNKCNLNFSDLKEKIKTILFFDPHVSEIFFAERVILVEGQSELVVINTLIKEEKLDDTNKSIICVYSKNNVLTYLNILNELTIPYSILIDMDPYWEPYFVSPNEKRLKEKKRAFRKTKKIIKKIDGLKGHLIIICPDFDKFLGISGNQIQRIGKPTATYKRLSRIESEEPNKLKEIEDLFKILIDPKMLNNNVAKMLNNNVAIIPRNANILNGVLN